MTRNNEPDETSAAEYSRINAIVATDTLMERLDALRETLHTQVVAARVFPIPTQTLAEDAPPTAPVADLEGQAAIDVATRALLRTDYDDDQHSKATVRVPGIVRVDPEMGQAMAEAIADVNQAKADLKTAMQALGYDAWRQWRVQIPAWKRLNKLQAYREWRWIDAPIAQLNFTWAGHTVSGEQVRIAALVERLRDQYERHGLTALEAEIDRLMGFDQNEVVVIRRPVSPTPMANIRFADGSRKAVKTALPFLTAQPLPTIKPLKNFDSEARSAKRNDATTEAQPLSSHLHVYRYVPARRFDLQANPTPVRLQWGAAGIEVRRAARGEPIQILPAPLSDDLALVASTAAETRGPSASRPRLGVGVEAPELVAANVANAFFNVGQAVWRVPIKELTALKAQVP